MDMYEQEKTRMIREDGQRGGRKKRENIKGRAKHVEDNGDAAGAGAAGAGAGAASSEQRRSLIDHNSFCDLFAPEDLKETPDDGSAHARADQCHLATEKVMSLSWAGGEGE
eukprot:214182-Hanusia_phi.AAC.2